jgi:hypothetical protein
MDISSGHSKAVFFLFCLGKLSKSSGNTLGAGWGTASILLAQLILWLLPVIAHFNIVFVMYGFGVMAQLFLLLLGAGSGLTMRVVGYVNFILLLIFFPSPKMNSILFSDFF